MEVVASLSQGRTAAAQCCLFTHKSVPVIFVPPCTFCNRSLKVIYITGLNKECHWKKPIKFYFKYVLQIRGVTNYLKDKIQSSQRQVPARNPIVSQNKSLNTAFLRDTLYRPSSSNSSKLFPTRNPYAVLLITIQVTRI